MDIKVTRTKKGGGELLTASALQEQMKSRGGSQRLDLSGHAAQGQPELPPDTSVPSVLEMEGDCDAAQHHIDKAQEFIDGQGLAQNRGLHQKYRDRHRALQKKLRG